MDAFWPPMTAEMSAVCCGTGAAPLETTASARDCAEGATVCWCSDAPHAARAEMASTML